MEQSEDSCKHSLIAAWSFVLDFGVHPVVEYYNRVTPLCLGRVRVRVRVRVRIRSGSGLGLESGWHLGIGVGLGLQS